MAPEPRIPTPEGLNAEFYAHAREGVLHLQRCTGCGHIQHPPRYLCAACGRDTYAWVPSRGCGRLFSWTVTHVAFDRGWADELPYATAVIELDEGVRLVGAVDGIAPDDLRLGLRLQTSLKPMGDHFVFLSFRPTGD